MGGRYEHDRGGVVGPAGEVHGNGPAALVLLILSAALAIAALLLSRSRRRAQVAALGPVESPYAVSTEGMKRARSAGWATCGPSAGDLGMRVVAEGLAGLARSYGRPAASGPRARSAGRQDSRGEQLADVQRRDRVLARRRDRRVGEPVAKHHHAERTRGRDRRRPRLEHLERPRRVDPRPARLLHPHPPAARAAAERLASRCSPSPPARPRGSRRAPRAAPRSPRCSGPGSTSRGTSTDSRQTVGAERETPVRDEAGRYCEWWRIENDPPSWPYSLPIVLKQCGHAVTIVRSPIR